MGGRVVGQLHAPVAFTPEKDPLPILQEARWAPGPVWTGAENLVPIGIRSPDLPVRSESLYRLSYPGPRTKRQKAQNTYEWEILDGGSADLVLEYLM
jgi:hypothetical protein